MSESVKEKKCKNCKHWDEFSPTMKGQGNCRLLTKQKRESGELSDTQGVATGSEYSCDLFSPKN